MKTKLFALLLISCIFTLNSFSQKKTETIYGIEKLTIYSKVLNEDRTMLIALPENYTNTTNNFPVLYLLDGNTHFRQASSATNFLAQQGLAPDMIVVAIINVDRNRDFTPVYNEQVPTSGGGEKFHDFLEKELLPFVEENYKASNYKILMGHSFGGTFVGYSLIERPNVFDAYIAASPYLQFDDDYIVNQARLKLKRTYNSPKNFYMTIGNEPEYFEAFNEFSILIEEKSGDAISFKYVKMPNENHGSIPYLTTFNGLRFIFSDFMLPNEVFVKGLPAIDYYYDQVSKKYNLEVETTENTINILGYNYLGEGELKKAIEVFKENVNRYPNSSNVYDSLGEAYEKDGEIKLAKDNYQIAYTLGLDQNHRATSIYKNNLDRVSK